MKPALVVFWVSCAMAAYTYLVYPVLLFIASASVQVWRDWAYVTRRQDRRRARIVAGEAPGVTLIVPAYNEARHLPAKLANLKALLYDSDRLHVIFVSDGSTDDTNEILSELKDEPNVQLVLLPDRRGKANALNEAVSRANTGILVFSDAATLFAPDAIRSLVRHFGDPTVGVVCGALQFQGSSASDQTEGVYWKYECMLRVMEARLGINLQASGAIYALRRECWAPLDPDTLIDDFVIPMTARRLGYRIVHDPEAVAIDFAASSIEGEFTRRVRLAVGSFRELPHLIGLKLDAATCLAFVSHKVFRWLLPFSLIGLLVSNVALAPGHPLYQATLALQATFYAWALGGFLFHERFRAIRFGLLGYYLVAMHLAFLVGFVRYLTVRHDGTWKRTYAVQQERA
jgi:cellulose synthase/poly-beta-1,6-N-acetylglucosamine synthase-like glycosyltransferase